MIQSGGMKYVPPLIVGNWKLNPGLETEAVDLAKVINRKTPKEAKVTIAIAPPFIFIPAIAKVLKKAPLFLAAQDVAPEERGALTGEVSLSQLKPYGVTHFIIGHSERRALGETDELVNKKIQAVLKQRLTPIVCVGERTRDSQGGFYSIVEQQLRKAVAGLTPLLTTRMVIAYEPVWAIGTGATATPEDVKEMQLFIVSVLTKIHDRATASKVKLLYGGSVKASNAKALHQEGGMNGFLVGGASLDPQEFGEIIKATAI